MKSPHVIEQPNIDKLNDSSFHPEFKEAIPHISGLILEWREKKKPNIIWGKINFVKIFDLCSDWNFSSEDWDEEESGPPVLKHFHIVDYYGGDRGVGDFEGDYASKSLFYYDFSGSELRCFGLDVISYTSLAIMCHRSLDWPPALIAYRMKKSNAELTNLKTNLPRLYPDFNADAFLKLYEELYFKDPFDYPNFW